MKTLLVINEATYQEAKVFFEELKEAEKVDLFRICGYLRIEEIEKDGQIIKFPIPEFNKIDKETFLSYDNIIFLGVQEYIDDFKTETRKELQRMRIGEIETEQTIRKYLSQMHGKRRVFSNEKFVDTYYSKGLLGFEENLGEEAHDLVKSMIKTVHSGNAIRYNRLLNVF